MPPPSPITNRRMAKCGAPSAGPRSTCTRVAVPAATSWPGTAALLLTTAAADRAALSSLMPQRYPVSRAAGRRPGERHPLLSRRRERSVRQQLGEHGGQPLVLCEVVVELGRDAQQA